MLLISSLFFIPFPIALFMFLSFSSIHQSFVFLFLIIIASLINQFSIFVLLCIFLPLGFSRRGIVMITVSVSVSVSVCVNILHFSRYRSQFKSDPYQTWHDDWLWVEDDAYCWTFRSGDHSRSGPLVST